MYSEVSDMKTILVCNQKGGVGKSLVADEIAFSFERSGIPVSFYDLDAQGGTLHRTREADGAQVALSRIHIEMCIRDSHHGGRVRIMGNY